MTVLYFRLSCMRTPDRLIYPRPDCLACPAGARRAARGTRAAAAGGPRRPPRTPGATCLPHGGLRTFHQKSTCLHASNFRELCGANLAMLSSEVGGPETLVVYRVGSPLCGRLKPTPKTSEFYVRSTKLRSVCGPSFMKAHRLAGWEQAGWFSQL